MNMHLGITTREYKFAKIIWLIAVFLLLKKKHL